MRKNPKEPLVTILATSYNTKVFIKKFMTSIMKTTYPHFEVVIVDDHSEDGSYEWLKENYGKNSKVTILRNRRNMRLAYSRTKGVKVSRGTYIALMDVDTTVKPDWVREAVKILEKDRGIAVLQTVVYDLFKKDIIATAGLKIIPQLGWVIQKDFGQKRLTYPSRLLVFPGTTGIFFRRTIFKRIGYYDNKIGFNIDDVDFGLRLSLAGYRTYVDPKSVTYHLTIKSRQEREKVIKRLEWEFQFMKMPRIFLKNYELKNILLALPIFLAFALARSILWIFRGNVRPFFGFAWALIWNIWMLPDTLRERRRVQQLRRISDKEMFERVGTTSILGFDTFIKLVRQISAARRLSLNYRL